MVSVASAILGCSTNVLTTLLELKARGPERVPGTYLTSLNFDKVSPYHHSLRASVRKAGWDENRDPCCGLGLWIWVPVLGGIIGNNPSSTQILHDISLKYSFKIEPFLRICLSTSKSILT